MLVLDTTTALVKMVTSAAGDVDAHVSAADHTTSTDDFDSDAQNTNGVVTAATTTILASPGAGVKRNAICIFIRNVHASVANIITVLHTDGTTEVELFEATLAAGEHMVMNEQGTWFVYDANGGVKTGASAATETAAGLIEIASVAEMEAGTDVTRAVTPGYFNRHPASPKAWVSCGLAADIQQSYNVTNLTDTGTGIVTVNIATDFAAATYMAQVTVEQSGTTYAVAAVRSPHIRSATRAVGSVGFDCIDKTATTNLVKDPVTWHISMWGDQ